MPKNGAYLDSLGWAYFKLGKLDEAEKYLLEAVRIYDYSAAVHEHVGDLYQKRGKSDEARAAWQKALSYSTSAEQSTRIRSKLSGDPKK